MRKRKRGRAIPDRAIATSTKRRRHVDRLGNRTFEAELHRVRGQRLLERDPLTPPPRRRVPVRRSGREAQGAAQLRIARRAGAGQTLSIDRPAAEAHAVLAPALEGFAATPEFAEVGEARALLAEIAQ